MESEKEQSKLKSKRSNNELDSTLLQTWYPQVRSIREAVHSVLESRKSK